MNQATFDAYVSGIKSHAPIRNNNYERLLFHESGITIEGRRSPSEKFEERAQLYYSAGQPRWSGPGVSISGKEAIRRFENFTGAQLDIKIEDL